MGRRIGRCLWRVVIGVALTVLAVVLVMISPAGDWVGRQLVVLDPLEKADCIVLLCGNRERAFEAARLYREGWAPRIIVTGSDDDPDRYVRLLTSSGVPAEAIAVDRLALRTHDHPVTVAKVEGIDPAVTRVMLVTSVYHTSRSKACFERAGYRHVSIQAPQWHLDVAEPGPRGPLKRLIETPTQLYEIFAWGLYRARGWL